MKPNGPRELPIIFTAESVRAILAGRKTQTRRLLAKDSAKPRFRVGDVLWVKEAWRTEELEDMDEIDEDSEMQPGTDGIRFRADGSFRPIENTEAASEAWIKAHRRGNAWRSPLYMPRWASRLSLEVTEVRAQRVQAISEEDAVAEGFAGSEIETPREQFASAWDVINGRKANWSSNPWVFAYTFRRSEK